MVFTNGWRCLQSSLNNILLLNLSVIQNTLVTLSRVTYKGIYTYVAALAPYSAVKMAPEEVFQSIYQDCTFNSLRILRMFSSNGIHVFVQTKTPR
jgi:hypothetical protein